MKNSTQCSIAAFWNSICLYPEKNFYHSPDEKVSYRNISSLIRRFCSLFDDQELAPGDRVVIVTASESVACAAFLAALLDGKLPVMVSPDSKRDRVIAIFQSLEPRLCIIDDQLYADIKATLPSEICILNTATGLRIESSRHGVITVLGNLFGNSRSCSFNLPFELPDAEREPRIPKTDESIAYVLFTSGTTKSPSGVKISRKNLAAQLETLTRLFNYSDSSRIFNPTPLAHTDGLVQGLLLSAVNGSTLIRPGAFTVPGLDEWLDRIVSLDATHFVTNPTILAFINQYSTHTDYFYSANFHGILSSGSILRNSLWNELERKFGCPVYNLYGMTETVANATYAGRHPEMGPVGSIGLPVDCEVRLMAKTESGIEQESAVEGELQIRGENIFLGYWNDTFRTSSTLIEDGWMRTGDLARRHEDGGYEIIGRVSTVINMGGQKIMPEEVDETLLAHPGVVDAATVGIPDPDFEQIAVSAVVLDRDADEDELTRHCHQRLERLKIPKKIVAVEKIPRGDAGKPDYAELRDILESLLKAPESRREPANSKGVTPDLVFQMAAQVFHVSAATLDEKSSPETVSGWDSFNQINLVLEAENRFGVRISPSSIASIKSLGDLYRTILSNQ